MTKFHTNDDDRYMIYWGKFYTSDQQDVIIDINFYESHNRSQQFYSHYIVCWEVEIEGSIALVVLFLMIKVHKKKCSALCGVCVREMTMVNVVCFINAFFNPSLHLILLLLSLSFLIQLNFPLFFQMNFKSKCYLLGIQYDVLFVYFFLV